MGTAQHRRATGHTTNMIQSSILLVNTYCMHQPFLVLLLNRNKDRQTTKTGRDRRHPRHQSSSPPTIIIMPQPWGKSRCNATCPVLHQYIIPDTCIYLVSPKVLRTYAAKVRRTCWTDRPIFKIGGHYSWDCFLGEKKNIFACQ